MAEQLHFFCRLIPPRADFMQTMSEAERDIMRLHVGFWTEKVTTGNALVFGPVADPAGGYGIGIIRADSREAMGALRDSDPAILSGIGFRYDILPMPRIVIAGRG